MPCTRVNYWIKLYWKLLIIRGCLVLEERYENQEHWSNIALIPVIEINGYVTIWAVHVALKKSCSCDMHDLYMRFEMLVVSNQDNLFNVYFLWCAYVFEKYLSCCEQLILYFINLLYIDTVLILNFAEIILARTQKTPG